MTSSHRQRGALHDGPVEQGLAQVSLVHGPLVEVKGPEDWQITDDKGRKGRPSSCHPAQVQHMEAQVMSRSITEILTKLQEWVLEGRSSEAT